jgi:hypothetical protein
MLRTKIRNTSIYLWNSPTMMTWGSFASRSLSLILVLPLVLNRLSSAEVVLWYLFSTIIGLQVLADLGFSPTFSRVIAYGMGGLKVSEFTNIAATKQQGRVANWETIEEICVTMKKIYLLLTIVSIFCLMSCGTAAVFNPILAISNPFLGWIAWGVILLTSTLTFLGNNYNSYLQGINQVALLRRWETLTSLAAIFSSFLVLWLDGGLLGLVITNQIWLVFNVFRNRWLCFHLEEGRFGQFQSRKINPLVFRFVWSSAWRSGLGVLMSYGVVQLSAVAYAQLGKAPEVASYLLAVRLIQVVNQFSQAPFYSKLPLFAKLFSEGNIEQEIRVAKKGMMLSYWTYTIGFIILGVSGPPILQSIGSNTEFVNPWLWGLMGLSLFAERYGAMHLQLYNITNHIISHVANGVSGIIYLVFIIAFFNQIGVYAFPIGLLVSYLGFYCWYAAMHSYRAFGLKFWEFERDTMLPSFCLLSFYLMAPMILRSQ